MGCTSQVGRFWRFLLANFPETLDYLASADDEQRMHFSEFTEVMYEQYFESGDEMKSQLYQVVNDR